MPNVGTTGLSSEPSSDGSQAAVAAGGSDGAGQPLAGTVGLPAKPWASDEVATHLDELQFSLGEGPCVQPFTERRPVLVGDLAEVSDPRWPVFASAAAKTPVRAVFVLPVQAGAITVGVLEGLTATSPEPWHRTISPGRCGRRTPHCGACSTCAVDDPTGLAGTAKQSAPAGGWTARRCATGPPGHRATGPPGHRATGMIIAQMDVTAETALAALRAFAFAHDRPLSEVARDVVARRLRFGEEGR